MTAKKVDFDVNEDGEIVSGVMNQICCWELINNHHSLCEADFLHGELGGQYPTWIYSIPSCSQITMRRALL
jgi:hypothetical protein